MPLILVIENDDAGREVLAEFFSEEGFAVRATPAGPEALAALRCEAPDLVLLDLRLPARDAFRMLNEVQALAPDRRAVVVMTASNPMPYLCQLADHGVEHVLAKPYDLDALLALTEHLTDCTAERLPGPRYAPASGRADGGDGRSGS